MTQALAARGKDVWIDVQDIRGGASDWRASVWAAIEASTTVVFLLTPDSLASTVCGEELQRATELNKRIVPVLRRSVDGLPIPPPLARPNWILARAEDDFEKSVASLVSALELDEAWVEQHARLAQRTGEWLRHDRDGSYLLRGSDLRSAEAWLDDRDAHHEAPTADQVTYITASRRAAARRQRTLLAGVLLALVITAALAVVAFAQRQKAIHREQTARAQARAAQSIAALSRDPEESVRDALEAVKIRPGDPEARYALRRALSATAWTSILRVGPPGGAGLREVDFSRDGRRVATAGADGTAAVWDTRTGRRIMLVAHRRRVNSVQFSPDGRQLLTASADGTARVWDISKRRAPVVFDTRSTEVWAATFAAGGRRILTASPDAARVWKTTGALLARLPNNGEYQGTIRLSDDGRRALTSDGKRGAVLWDVDTRRPIARLPTRGDPVAFSLFSGDGQRVATLGKRGGLSVWDVRGKSRLIKSFPEGDFYDADLSRDGRRVLRADTDGRVEVWDVDSKRHISLRNGTPASSAQFDRRGNYVVTGDDNGVARVWQVNPNRLLEVLRGHTGPLIRARFSPGGNRVVTASADGSARLWPSRPEMPVDPRWQVADSVAFSPTSRYVLVVQAKRRAVWDTVTGRVTMLDGGILQTDELTWPCGRAAGCSPWSRDDGFVAGADSDGVAAIWNAHTGHVVRRFAEEKGQVSGAAFGPDGRKLLLWGEADPTALIVNRSTGGVEARVPDRRVARVPLSSAQFVRNPLRVLTIDVLGHVRVSTPATGASAELRVGTPALAVAAAANGRRVAIGTRHALSVFSGPTHTQTSQPTTNGAVNSLAFDRSGTVIAAAEQEGMTLWDMRRVKATTLRTPGGEVMGATFSRDGNLVLVTAGSSATLWDWRDFTQARPIVELPPTAGARAEFSPDGRRIVLAGRSRLEVIRCDACAPLDAQMRRARSLLPADD